MSNVAIAILLWDCGALTGQSGWSVMMPTAAGICGSTRLDDGTMREDAPESDLLAAAIKVTGRALRLLSVVRVDDDTKIDLARARLYDARDRAEYLATAAAAQANREVSRVAA